MKDVILGMKLLFARAGETIDSVVVGPEAKPDNVPDTNYTVVASCEGWQVRKTANRVTRRAPTPGRYQARKTILLNKQIEYAFNLQEWSDMTFAEMMLGGEEPVAGVFEPNARDEDVTGWWLMRGYDQTDAAIIALDVYGEGRVEPFQFGENVNPFALIVRQLTSTLNTGEVSNLT